MLVELRPGLLSNRGGELMLLAAIDRLARHELAVEPWIGPYPDRARLGLYQKPWFNRAGPLAGVTALVPGRLRSMLGVVTEAQVDAVVDLSGFALSDHFGPGKAERAARNARRWKRAGKVLVLLPQAFGPFQDHRVAAAARTVLEQADLVFARDAESLAHVTALIGRRPSIRSAPDFTHTVAAVSPTDAGAWPPTMAIVPNEKMLTHAGSGTAAAYRSLLVRAAEIAGARGLRVIGVVHEAATDRTLLESLQRDAAAPIEMFDALDVRALKGVLGACRLVVGSRYHALVSALSQGVPVVASGWSHKYAALLQDFGCSEQLVDPLSVSADALDAAVDRCLDAGPRAEMLARMADGLGRVSAATEAMWTEVETRLSAHAA